MLSVRRLAFTLLAAVSVVRADSVCKGDATIDSDGDVSKYSSCSTIDGDLTVGSKVTTLALDQLSQINGGFSINGAAGLTSISMAKLQSIGKEMSLHSLTVLSSLSMPQLVSCGSLDFTTLGPGLTSLQFTKQITMASDVIVSDTFLASLQGINVVTVDTFNINNNKFLKKIDVALANVSNILSISDNGQDLNASFSNLIWANNITIHNVSGISFPSLSTINNSMTFVQNTFETVSFPNLTDVGQSLSFVSCSGLTNVTAPKLTHVGGTFQFANNTKLANVTSFPVLETVGGTIDFSGVLESVSLPKLDDVRGSVNIQSTETLDGCNAFDTLKHSNSIRGSEMCKGALTTASSTEGGASTTGGSGNESSSSSKDGKTGDASRASISIVVAVLSLGAVVVSL